MVVSGFARPEFVVEIEALAAVSSSAAASAASSAASAASSAASAASAASSDGGRGGSGDSASSRHVRSSRRSISATPAAASAVRSAAHGRRSLHTRPAPRRAQSRSLHGERASAAAVAAYVEDLRGSWRLEAEDLPISPHISPYLAPRSGRSIPASQPALERTRLPLYSTVFRWIHCTRPACVFTRRSEYSCTTPPSRPEVGVLTTSRSQYTRGRVLGECLPSKHPALFLQTACARVLGSGVKVLAGGDGPNEAREIARRSRDFFWYAPLLKRHSHRPLLTTDC